jgi:hypothetical protein
MMWRAAKAMGSCARKSRIWQGVLSSLPVNWPPASTVSTSTHALGARRHGSSPWKAKISLTTSPGRTRAMAAGGDL